MSALLPEAGGGGAKAPLIEVDGLKKHFPIYKGVFSRVSGQVYAVDGVRSASIAARPWVWSARAAAASPRSGARC